MANANLPYWSHLLDIQRAGLTERSIFGAVAVSDATGILEITDADPKIFGRSLMKPWQMKPLAETLDGTLGWEEKALALASHSGTAKQVEVAQRILPSSDWAQMALPASLPLGGTPAVKNKWFNPCSGKHAAILRACLLRDWPTENYLSAEHPYGQAYRQALEQRLDISFAERTVAPDGCLLPTYALEISEMARLMAMLATERRQDWIWEAFRRHPELIGGPNRLDTRLMQALPTLIAKEGADGLLGLALADDKYPRGWGCVIKLAHGYDVPMLWQVAFRVLTNLGLDVPAPPELAGQDIVPRF